MKKITLFFALVAMFAQAKAQFIKAELEVSGLTCSMCSLSTQKSLNTLDFIGQIKPDLNKNIFYITFRADKAVSLDALKQKVQAAGFSVSKLIAIYDFKTTQDNASFQYNGDTYQFTVLPGKPLSGEIRLQVLDKDFVPTSTFKKLGAQIKDASYATGGTNDKKQRVYHISLS
ncbi:cation transporter [uncultured Mucilaginibacter sp.]|uniref:heavy-metal-associated domain-containing protein n=1 Tax=uncultured Mucilaginibacter sp. TaxID=797541 RepID=UPI0025D20924|nr:cation transporter [uncultured Mucilaginibacter sp.]